MMWEQWAGIIQRGRPETLVLCKLQPKITVKRAPGPGAVRKIEWKALGSELLQDRKVILHTDSAKSYKLKLPGVATPPLRADRRPQIIDRCWRFLKERVLVNQQAAHSSEQSSGELENWEDWSWQFQLYIEIHHPIALKVMVTIEESGEPLSNCTLGSFVDEEHTIEDLLDLSKRLHYLLVQVTIGTALDTVRSIDKGNGFEAWRLLHEMFSLRRVRGIELLNCLVNHEFREDHIEDDLSAFILLVRKYEEAIGSIALLVNKTEVTLKGFLRFRQSSIQDI
eukprot:s1682_g5.t1